MDILKDQIAKLKQIVQQQRDERAALKGQVKSLETVNKQLKDKVTELENAGQTELETIKSKNVEMHE